EADHVLVYDSDRFSRALLVKLLAWSDLEKHGARVLFVCENYDDSPEGHLFANLRSCVSEFEREKIRERTSRGKLRKAKEGLFPVALAPYGLRIVTHKDVASGNAPEGAKAGTILLVEEEAKVIRRIFHLYTVEGKSLRQIQAILTAEGIPAAKGGAWSPTSVSNILTNEHYLGAMRFNQWRSTMTKEIRNGKPVRKRWELDPSQWIEIPCPAIMDRATFERAQERLKGNKNSRSGNPERVILLTSFLRCPHCRRRMAAERARPPRGVTTQYRCPAAHEVTPKCDYKSMHAGSIVETAVCAGLRHILTNPDLIASTLLKRAREGEQRQAERQAERTRLKAVLKECEEAERRLLKAFTAGFSEEAIGSEREEIQARRQAAKSRSRELETAEETLAKLPTPEDVADACKLVAEAWDAVMETAERRAFIGRMVEWVEPRRNGVRMQIKPLSILPAGFAYTETVHTMLIMTAPLLTSTSTVT
ncbi:MAG TPA: recombinase family protein, partial [Chthonomonadaceae bacterium]|nr:recombinase family protein [Chthonomonadaceae bacterium]